jgi:hypothetical protein
MKKQFLMSCVFVTLFSGQGVNAMEKRISEQETVESIDFRSVEVPQTLSYLDGKFRLELISQPQDYLVHCDRIRTKIQQKTTTENCLRLLYKLLPNYIWKNECDECYILIKIEKRSDGSFECKADFCAIYHDDAGDANYHDDAGDANSFFHFCNEWNGYVASKDYKYEIERLIRDYMASALCFGAGLFHMCLSNDLRSHFIDFEKKVVKPFAIFSCGHLSEYQEEDSWFCVACNTQVPSAIGLKAKPSLGQNIIKTIYGGIVPVPAGRCLTHKKSV